MACGAVAVVARSLPRSGGRPAVALHGARPTRRQLGRRFLSRRFIAAIAAAVSGPQLTSRPVAQERRQWDCAEALVLLHVPMFWRTCCPRPSASACRPPPLSATTSPAAGVAPTLPSPLSPATASLERRRRPQAAAPTLPRAGASAPSHADLAVGSLPLLAEASCCRTRACCPAKAADCGRQKEERSAGKRKFFVSLQIFELPSSGKVHVERRQSKLPISVPGRNQSRGKRAAERGRQAQRVA